MEIENLEQPNLESENSIIFSADNTNINSENQEGSMIGKFKDAKSLLDAYNSLEAEFTRKSQKLAELQKIQEENANFKSFENIDEFLKSTTDSDKYKKEITEILTNDQVNNLPNKYQVALLIAKEAESKSAKILNDQNFIDNNILTNSEIKNRVISDYLSKLNYMPESPKVISGNSANVYFSPNENKPKTIKEAGNIFSKMLN